LHRGFSIFPQTQPFPQALTAETSLEREVQRFQQLRHQAVARAKAFIEASTSFSPVKCGISPGKIVDFTSSMWNVAR